MGTARIVHRRPRPAPPFSGWTDAGGERKDGAPRDWPFGTLPGDEIFRRRLQAILVEHHIVKKEST
jgi:hypothetical protein